MNTKPEIGSADNELGALLTFKAEVIAELSHCKNDRAKQQKLTHWLQRELDLEGRQESLWEEMKVLAAERQEVANIIKNRNAEFAGTGESNGGDIESAESALRPGGKERAAECRAAYLEREKFRGRALTKIRGIYYKGPAGLSVGITWSGESDQTWFFNLKDGRFHEAVLLCENGQASVQALRLPRPFLDQYGRKLSRDKNGMVKFYIQLRGGRMQLQVPEPVGWVDVTPFMDAENLNCSHEKYKRY
jgi:hypothetical protein